MGAGFTTHDQILRHSDAHRDRRFQRGRADSARRDWGDRRRYGSGRTAAQADSGFDAPESGFRAQCESERALAAKATFRLRQLVSAGGLDLELIPCSCRPGTEGTRQCNYGRAAAF
jgi:hypothetical protein